MPKLFEDKYNFRKYSSKVLGVISPDYSLTATGSNELNLLIHYLIENVIDNSCSLIRGNTKTIQSNTIQNAFELILPREIFKKASSDGVHAITLYNSRNISEDEPKSKGKDEPRTHVSESFKSGLIFSTSRIHNIATNLIHKDLHLGKGANIYLTAVIEYIVSEILDLARVNTRDSNRKRVTSTDIARAIKNDPNLNEIFKKVTF